MKTQPSTSDLIQKLVWSLLVFGLIFALTSCTCTLDGEGLARAIIIYQTK